MNGKILNQYFPTNITFCQKTCTFELFDEIMLPWYVLLKMSHFNCRRNPISQWNYIFCWEYIIKYIIKYSAENIIPTLVINVLFDEINYAV